MPGPIPHTGPGLARCFGSLSKINETGLHEGSVANDVNIVAVRTFKQRSTNAKGQSITTTYRSFQRMKGQNPIGPVFSKAIHRSRSFTPGEIIGLILAYILLTPLAGVVIHSFMISAHEEAVPSGRMTRLTLKTDDNGNIEEPEGQYGIYGPLSGIMLGSGDIELPQNKEIEVFVKPQESGSGGKTVSLTPEPENLDQLKRLRTVDVEESSVNDLLARNLVLYNPKINVESHSKAQNSPDLQRLPLFLKRFLASPQFGGVHTPMQLNTSPRVDSISVEVTFKDNNNTEHTKTGNIAYGHSKPPEIKIVEVNETTYSVTQTFIQKPQIPGVEYAIQRESTTTITVAKEQNSDNYQIASIDQTTEYKK